MTFNYTELKPFALRIDSEERKVIGEIAQGFVDRHHGTSLNDDDVLYEIEIATGGLPPSLRRELAAFRDHSNTHGAMLITGLPVGDIPATPKNFAEEPDWSDVALSSVTQLMLMSLLGRVISYEDEKNGLLLQDIYPKEGSESLQENSGSVLLELHTEDGFHPSAPHFLSLLGLRSDADGEAVTVTAGIEDVLPHLSSNAKVELRRPAFQTKYSTSFVGSDGREVLTEPGPILSGCPTSPDLCVDFHAVHCLDSTAQRALDELEIVMRSHLYGTVLEPGDMVIIDNRRAVHGRTAFRPTFDGKDRWLRRSFALADLRPARQNLNGRQHAPITA
ncbi:L-asparagine oxygenase [Flexivirga sp. ID2601S]|uniref:L-asparagine oxygenase n=1 Tax=Flexivirga aerilata TaxID=1656889 RepID=A0A849AD33_9MICO|nr:TauD/TfdA family dioxygenase [Flexivirga aerilata]NNG38379.1 L-asparagine oxygenase [Flexivirga aerilata]